MYCGNNRTALASQQQIAQAALQLIRKKSYASISVSELCKEAGISRQTFYSLFESKDNVMVFILQELYCYEPPANDDSHPSCIEQLCREYSRYICHQKDFIQLLVRNNITYLLNDSFYDALTHCSCFLSAMEPSRRPYAAHFIAGGFTSIAQTFIAEGGTADEDFLFRICLQLFEGNWMI